MLYLHCGWPRTGTTSLQAVLRDRREDLAAAGVVYPERWQDRGGAHHGIVELLDPNRATDGLFADFRRYLAAQGRRNVLISAEGLSNWLPDDLPEREGFPRGDGLGGGRAALLKLVEAAQQVTPVTCVFTLCVADRLLDALCLHRLLRDAPDPFSLTRCLDGIQRRSFIDIHRWLGGIGGFAELSDAVEGRARFFRYEQDGSHQEQIVGAVGLPPPLVAAIVATLRSGARRNPRISQKGVVALLHTGAIEARLGTALSREALWSALRSGELRFDGDVACRPTDPRLREAIRDEALRASREARFEPYPSFFADDVLVEPQSPDLDPGILDDADLERLRLLADGRP